MGFNDTTLALPPTLKEELRALKVIPNETFSSVLRRIIDDAKKVPELENRIVELDSKLKELEGEKK